MSLAVVRSRALDGLDAPAVHVEVQLANGLPSFTLVGLADTEVKEARERVRAALQHSGFGFPHNRRITVNLAPADLPKESGRFDLPIALGILAADGVLDAARLAEAEFAGELSLAGELRPVRGALALALASRRESAADALGGGVGRADDSGNGHAASSADRCAGRRAPGTGRAELGDEAADSPVDASAAVPRPAPSAASRVPRADAGPPGPRGARTLVLPSASAAAAARVAGLDVRGASTLIDVVRSLLPGDEAEPLPPAQPASAGDVPPVPDLRDVKGQAGAKRALEIAAAGQHSLLLIGPPGTGKSMLAARLPGLLPPMDDDEALVSAALLGLTAQGLDGAAFGRRPVRSPHHSASAVALVGGGSPPRPGEISLAHGGILFLDEVPEFPRAALEALREPLEAGRITISRAARQAQFPARFQLVAAMNPCPCGWLGAPAATGRACRCTPEAVARYQGRLSGPLLDRIDLQIEVPAVRPAELMAAPDGEASAAVAERVAAARGRQIRRQGEPNGLLDAARTDACCAAEPAARRFLQTAAEKLGWSGRRLHRTLRVARTIADLAGDETVGVAAVAEALQLQRGLDAAGR